MRESTDHENQVQRDISQLRGAVCKLSAKIMWNSAISDSSNPVHRQSDGHSVVKYAVENPTVSEQVVVSKIPEVPSMERIQEQIVESIKEVPQERVQQRTVEQNVCMSVPIVQEQMHVQEIPGTQIVERIQKQIAETIPQERVQRTSEQDVCVSVPTVQEQTIVQEVPGTQVVERIQKQIAETIPQERVQRTVEQNVCMSVPLAAPRAATVSPSVPVSVFEHATPTPVDMYTKPAPVIDFIPTPVIEYIAPSAAVSYPSFLPSIDQIHEAVTDSENPQFSITADETSKMSVERIQEQSAVSDLVTSVVSSPVVESVPLLHAVEYGMPDLRVPAPQVQEQMNVQEIPGTQVVKRIQKQIVETVPQERDQRTDEQDVRVSVPTVQEQMTVQGIPELQVVEQKLEQTVEAMEVKLLERVQRRAVEQSVRLFELLEEFDKRLEKSEARRAENNELIKEIGVLWEERRRQERLSSYLMMTNNICVSRQRKRKIEI